MDFTPKEMMGVVASRQLSNDDVCLVGIGAPSVACNLARLTHAPDIQLVYESGTISTQPSILPLSIGDGELCGAALTTVSLPEMFRYWLGGGHITVGFLGAAQIDRFANINTTVIGDYAKPKVRLPGAGGAPEIATSCERTFVILPMTSRHFVDELSFRTTLGHGEGGDSRERLGVNTFGPTKVITDLCLLEPDAETKELTVVEIYPGVEREQIKAACGWPIRFAPDVHQSDQPTANELKVLRDLHQRTQEAHLRDAERMSR